MPYQASNMLIQVESVQARANANVGSIWVKGILRDNLELYSTPYRHS